VQMPSLAAIQPVEDEAGLPVLSAATATAFTILNELGLAPIVPNAGSLLAGGQRLAERAGRIRQDPQPA
jgi:maleate isomerase